MPVPGRLILFHFSFAAECYVGFASGSAVSACISMFDFYMGSGVRLPFGSSYYV